MHLATVSNWILHSASIIKHSECKIRPKLSKLSPFSNFAFLQPQTWCSNIRVVDSSITLPLWKILWNLSLKIFKDCFFSLSQYFFLGRVTMWDVLAKDLKQFLLKDILYLKFLVKLQYFQPIFYQYISIVTFNHTILSRSNMSLIKFHDIFLENHESNIEKDFNLHNNCYRPIVMDINSQYITPVIRALTRE